MAFKRPQRLRAVDGGASDAPSTGPVIATGLVETDRLHLSAWNPRSIEGDQFARLCESIRKDPEFLEERPVLARADGTIYAGHMRYRAVTALYADGWESPWGADLIPARLRDVDEHLAQSRSVRDNNQWGDWQELELAAMLADLERRAAGTLPTLGFLPDELATLFQQAGIEGHPDPFTGESGSVGRGGTEPDRPLDGDEPPTSDGSLLALVNVTIAEPTHVVTRGDVWYVGDHLLACSKVMTEWGMWIRLLEPGRVLVPYPGPFAPLTLVSEATVLVMVQPDPYIAGHILDRYAEIHGEDRVGKLSSTSIMRED